MFKKKEEPAASKLNSLSNKIFAAQTTEAKDMLRLTEMVNGIKELTKLFNLTTTYTE